MACCCEAGKQYKSTVSCLGRCHLPKHRCLDKEEVKPGRIPKYMGWLWDARTSPEHQLRCGWRPGHIACPVLRMIQIHNSCLRDYPQCPSSTCTSKLCTQKICSRRNCAQKICLPLSCMPRPCPPKFCLPKICAPRVCPAKNCTTCGFVMKPCLIKPVYNECVPPVSCLPSTISCCSKPCNTTCQSVIRIIRHGGKYDISTKPSDLNNSPSGPNPLKYVLDVDPNEPNSNKVKYSVEAKFNEYQFDYTTSQTSFVLDFSPPEQKKCYKPCPKRSITCLDPCPRLC